MHPVLTSGYRVGVVAWYVYGRCVREVSQLFDDIMKAASKKAEPIVCNVVLMNAGRQTEVSMAIALALQYQLKNALA